MKAGPGFLAAFPHLAARIVGAPLLIHPEKLDVVLTVLNERAGGNAGLTKLSHGERAQRKRSDFEVTSEGIAIIPVFGILMQRGFGLDALSGLRSYAKIREEIEDAVTDPAVKGILLEIDSPGGEVNGVFDLSDLIFESRGLKPIWAVANEEAASAAYAIASAAERVILPRTARVGSIGAVAVHVDESEADKMAGLKFSFIQAGEKKTDANAHEPLSDSARQEIQAEVDRVFDLFVATVARNRGIPERAVRETEAGLFFGPNAVTAGLADGVETFQGSLEKFTQQLQRRERIMTVKAEAGGDGAGSGAPLEAAEGQESPDAVSVQGEPSGKVVNLDEARSEAKMETLAYVQQVGDLCLLAGRPDLINGFVEKGLSVEEVRAALLDEKAKADGDEVVSRHDGEDSDAAGNYGWDRAFAHATGRKLA